MTNEKIISVVIPVYNRIEELKLCLDSLLKQSYKALEIIVIDDNSKENIKDFLNRNYKQVRYFKTKKRYYPAHLKNMGIKMSNGEYILFIDSDIEFFQKNTIMNSLNFLKKYKEFVAVGGEAGFNEKGKHISVHAVKFKILKNFTIGARDHFFENFFKEVDFLETNNFMIKKEIIVKLGGFDPGFKYPHEDADVCYRLKKKGLKVGINFSSAIIHKRSSIHRMNSVYFTTRARIRYQIKHFGLFKTHFYNVLDRPILSRRLPKIYESINPKQKIYAIPGKYPNTENGGMTPVKVILYLYYIHKAILINLLDLKNIINSREMSFLKC